MKLGPLIGSAVLIGSLLGGAAGLYFWKLDAIARAEAEAASQPDFGESVTPATATAREYTPTTSVIGTVLALRSVRLRNELPGTVRQAALEPGAIVEEGSTLVTLDTAVEEATLAAQRAQAELAAARMRRLERALETRAASELDVEQAQAEHRIALAEVARTEAIIAQKVLRAPFRARIGLSDLHVGQYLEAGTDLTTLQSVDDEVDVDFQVAQPIAARLAPGATVEVLPDGSPTAVSATVIALDARVDVETRNAMVRARIPLGSDVLRPGSSVRVRVPAGDPRPVTGVPTTALRRGPQGDHVFVLEKDAEGTLRAHERRVQVATMVGDEILLSKGIEPGVVVAASGSFKLREGVKIMQPPPGAEAGAAAESGAPAEEGTAADAPKSAETEADGQRPGTVGRSATSTGSGGE
jgi:membrane fusion protein (multidrug efflux system)